MSLQNLSIEEIVQLKKKEEEKGRKLSKDIKKDIKNIKKMKKKRKRIYLKNWKKFEI